MIVWFPPAIQSSWWWSAPCTPSSQGRSPRPSTSPSSLGSACGERSASPFINVFMYNRLDQKSKLSLRASLTSSFGTQVVWPTQRRLLLAFLTFFGISLNKCENFWRQKSKTESVIVVRKYPMVNLVMIGGDWWTGIWRVFITDEEQEELRIPAVGCILCRISCISYLSYILFSIYPIF